MRIIEIGSSDPAFRSVRFREGMNILLADKTREVGRGDTRNGTGKSSFVRIVRYLLGGNKEKELASEELKGVVFYVDLALAGTGGGEEIVRVSRDTSSTKVNISGWSVTNGDIPVPEWTELLGDREFGRPAETDRPTVSQLRGQFFRTVFHPTKVYGAEAGWESGVRIGFLLGLDPGILSKAGTVAKLKQQQKALRSASEDGALEGFDLDVPGLEGRLAAARRRRDRTSENLQGFSVDERYREHQDEANALSLRIRSINDRALALDHRLKEIDETLEVEVGLFEDDSGEDAATFRVYEEIGLLLPEVVTARYEQVREFHRSVISNRRLHLQSERGHLVETLSSAEAERSELDQRRASILTLLRNSVALDTFLLAERSLAELESDVADLEKQVDLAKRFDGIGDDIKIASLNAKQAVSAELSSHQTPIDEARAYFTELAQEIYGQSKQNPKEAELRIGASAASGSLAVEPRISGDASEGIRSVETFLLDIVLMKASIAADRNPRVLIHDSHLFDSVDSEQVADCINIGARLADELGFQYIVTMNSDDLRSAEAESDSGLDATAYLLNTQLSDETDDQRLYGRQID